MAGFHVTLHGRFWVITEARGENTTGRNMRCAEILKNRTTAPPTPSLASPTRASPTRAPRTLARPLARTADQDAQPRQAVAGEDRAALGE